MDQELEATVDLDYILGNLSDVHPKRRTEIFDKIVTQHNESLLTVERSTKVGRGNKCNLTLPKTIADEFLRLEQIKRSNFSSNKTTEGVVYCFISVGQLKDKFFVKVGQSIDWLERQKKYTGANSVETVVGVREVANRFDSEKILLDKFKTAFEHFKGEWYLVNIEDFKTGFLNKAFWGTKLD
jgi:hypothetical protein